ncbi:MAG: CoA pyrophosphatase [Pseudomonadota bacterium]|nr:CoA pyrophosphatase [Pseudomonadota bacterium]
MPPWLSDAVIRERIAREPGRPVDDPFPPGFLGGDAIPAAVLAPLVRVADDDWRLLFIRRTRRPDDPHSGQVAFPGGRHEPGDPDLRATALRELREELGVDPAAVRVLGEWNSHLTISNHRVTPFAGSLDWPCDLHRQPEEVSCFFTIPLDWLADPRNYRTQERPLPGSGSRIPVIVYHPFDGEVLWGLTARMTQRLLGILGYDCGR